MYLFSFRYILLNTAVVGIKWMIVRNCPYIILVWSDNLGFPDKFILFDMLHLTLVSLQEIMGQISDDSTWKNFNQWYNSSIRESFQMYLLSHTFPASSDLCCCEQDVYITYVIQYYKSKLSSDANIYYETVFMIYDYD